MQANINLDLDLDIYLKCPIFIFFFHTVCTSLLISLNLLVMERRKAYTAACVGPVPHRAHSLFRLTPRAAAAAAAGSRKLGASSSVRRERRRLGAGRAHPGEEASNRAVDGKRKLRSDLAGWLDNSLPLSYYLSHISPFQYSLTRISCVYACDV